jgi:hypothetical protein
MLPVNRVLALASSVGSERSDAPPSAALSGARESARRAQCASNLRQMHLIFLLYADEIEGSAPKVPRGTPMQNAIGGHPFPWPSFLDRYLPSPTKRHLLRLRA